MGKNFARKMICMVLALSLVLGTAAMAFAASGSQTPTPAKVYKDKYGNIYTNYEIIEKKFCHNYLLNNKTYEVILLFIT